MQGLLPPDRPSLEYGGVVVTPDQVGSGSWSYIAWGHYHVRHQVGPKGWYPGSLEYTSNNIWAERAEEEANGIPGKGWLMVDVATAAVTPHLVQHARQVIDLPPVYADGLDASQLDAAIADRVESVAGGIAQQIVRLVVHDVPRPVAREVDHARIRAWKASALHFHLDLRRPAPASAHRVGRARPAADAARGGTRLAGSIACCPPRSTGSASWRAVWN